VTAVREGIHALDDEAYIQSTVFLPLYNAVRAPTLAAAPAGMNLPVRKNRWPMVARSTVDAISASAMCVSFKVPAF